MSMIRCERCSRLIDSDDDPECFCTDTSGPDWAWKDCVLCEACREREEASEPDERQARFEMGEMP